LEYLRKILIVKINKESDFGLGDDIQILMSALAGRVTLENLIKIIEIFQKSGSEIKYSPVQGLPLELAAVESASLANSEKPELRQKEVPSAQPEEISKKDDSPQPELLQKIIQAWPQILEKLKDYNHSLVPSLKLAQPVEISGTDLIVTFPYKFHKDAVEARKNRIVVDQVIEEVTGEKLLIRPVMARDWEEKGLQTLDDATSKENGDKSLLESALKIIGGEMAE
jgi:DNA polymerase-3 subunit gamma/tau